jgi:transcriptional regulator with XRE-family HTH domain
MLAFDTTSSPETAKKLSHQFRRYRIICGMTQKRLSEKTGVALRTITRFENGEEVGLFTFISLLEGVGLTHNLKGIIPDVSGDLPQRVRRLTKKKKRKEGNTIG